MNKQISFFIIKYIMIFYYMLFISFDLLPLNNIDSSDQIILDLFDSENYQIMLNDINNTNTTKINEYYTKLYECLYAYFLDKNKHKGIIGLTNQNILNFFHTYINYTEKIKNNNINNNEETTFNEFKAAYPRFQNISFQLYQELSKSLEVMYNEFPHILERGIKKGYKSELKKKIQGTPNLKWIGFDVDGNEKKLTSIIENDTIYFSHLLKKDSFIIANELKKNNNYYIKFDLMDYKYNDLEKINIYYKSILAYAKENNIKVIFCLPNNPIFREAIITGKYPELIYENDTIYLANDRSKFLNIKKINSLSVELSEYNYALFMRMIPQEPTIIKIKIPSSLNNDLFKKEKIKEFMDFCGSHLPLDCYVITEVENFNNKLNFHFCPASASNYSSANLILKNNISEVSSKLNNLSLLNDWKKNIEELLLNSNNDLRIIENFRAFFLEKAYSELMQMIYNQSYWINGKLEICSHFIESTIKLLVQEYATKNGFQSTIQVRDIALNFMQKFTSQLMNIKANESIGSEVIFYYTPMSEPLIKGHENKYNSTDIYEKKKIYICSKVKEKFKNHFKKNDEIKMHSAINAAYDEIIDPQCFSENDLEELTVNIFLNNTKSEGFSNEKNRYNYNLIIKKHSDLSEVDKKRHFSLNRDSYFLFDQNITLSEEEVNNINQIYGINMHIKELQYYFQDIYQNNEKEIKIKMAWLIHKNPHLFKKNTEDSYSNLITMKRIMIKYNHIHKYHYDDHCILNNMSSKYKTQNVLYEVYNEYTEAKRIKNSHGGGEDRTGNLIINPININDCGKVNPDRVPEHIKIEYNNRAKLYNKNGFSEGPIPMVSYWGEPGRGKTFALYWQLDQITQACLEQGIDVANICALNVGSLVSPYVGKSELLVNELFDEIIDKVFEKNPNAHLYIFIDEADWTIPKDKDDQSGMGGALTAFKQRIQDKYKNVQFAFTSNKNLELGMDPAIKSRTMKGLRIIEINFPGTQAIQAMIKDGLISGGIEEDMKFDYNDLYIINDVIGKDQRTNLITEVVSYFKKIYPDKQYQTKNNFMEIIWSISKNKERDKFMKLLEEGFNKESYEKIPADKPTNYGEMLAAGMPVLGFAENIKNFAATFFSKITSVEGACAIIVAAAAYKYMDYKFTNQQIWTNGFVGFGIGALSYVPISSCRLSIEFDDWSIFFQNCRTLINNWTENNTFGKLPPIENYSEALGKKLINNNEESGHAGIIRFNLEFYRRAIGRDKITAERILIDNFKSQSDKYCFSNNPNNELLFANQKAFLEKVASRNKYREAFEDYVYTKCPNFQKILSSIGNHHDHKLKANLVLDIVFHFNTFNGKNNNYFALNEYEHSIKDAMKEFDLMNQIAKNFQLNRTMHSKDAGDNRSLLKIETEKSTAEILNLFQQTALSSKYMVLIKLTTKFKNSSMMDYIHAQKTVMEITEKQNKETERKKNKLHDEKSTVENNIDDDDDDED